jgi:hypothetical protein
VLFRTRKALENAKIRIQHNSIKVIDPDTACHTMYEYMAVVKLILAQ